MKKKNIMIAVVAIILLGIISFGIYYFINKEKISYELEKVNEYNYFILRQGDLYGVIDKNSNIIVDVEYEQIKIPNPEKNVFVCYKGNEVKVLNEKKEEILTQYEKIEPIRLKNIASDLMYEKSILMYYENGKYGLVNYGGKIITKPIYEQIEGLPHKEGELIVKQDDKYGVINIKGATVVESKYNSIVLDGYYSDEDQYKYSGYIVSKKTDEGYRYGYISDKLKVLLEAEYNDVSRITEIDDKDNVYVLAAKNGQYGMTNNGKQIISNEYQSIRYEPTNKLLVVEKNKKCGVLGLDGNQIIPIEYAQIDIIGANIYTYNEDTKVFNVDGSVADLDADIAIVKTGNENYNIKINNKDVTKYGIVDKEGNVLVKENYNYIEYLYEKYFIVSNDKNKLGIIDDKDNVIVEIKYDSIQKIDETDLIQASITQDKLLQIFSNEMKSICEMKNAYITKIKEFIKIYNETEIKYFNKEGIEIKNTEVYSNNKIFSNQKDGKWGFVDKEGNVIVDYKYDKVTEINEFGFAGVMKDGKWGVINKSGEETVEVKYNLKGDIEPSFIGQYYKVTYGFGEFYYTDENLQEN